MLLILCLLAAAAALPPTLPQQPTASTSSSTVAQRDKTLSSLFAEYWEQTLKDSPEMASTLGDKRYDDQLSDYSAAGYNARLERHLHLLEQFGAIDSTGLSEQTRLSKDLLVRQIVQERRRLASSLGRCRSISSAACTCRCPSSFRN